jgi:orotidine-5'-phosphate decarboxylase
MRAYGKMAYETMQADAMTVTAYMGIDAVEPLKEWLSGGCGAYVVWVSSNASGAKIQNPISGLLMGQLRELMDDGKLHGSLGLVYGATKFASIQSWDPEALAEFSLLMPGIGAQGGQVTESFRNFLQIHPSTLVPQSRSLGQLELYQGEEEPHSWHDFSLLVGRRLAIAAKDLAAALG